MTDLRTGPVAASIRRHRLVVVLRRIEPRARLLELVEELRDAGARIFEITFDGRDAAADLAAVRDALANSPAADACLVGAGTLLDRRQLREAREAGADFGVAPVLVPALVAEAVGAGLPFVPGAMTPSEIRAAWEAGATFVKLFPASAIGSGFVRELRGPLPEIELIPTGGVDADNATGFLRAGAAAVGIGSAIVRADAAERRRIVASVRHEAMS